MGMSHVACLFEAIAIQEPRKLSRKNHVSERQASSEMFVEQHPLTQEVRHIRFLRLTPFYLRLYLCPFWHDHGSIEFSSG